MGDHEVEQGIAALPLTPHFQIHLGWVVRSQSLHQHLPL
ncbi:Uncharacterised protein [Vibrio cholerae]|nr:Uncharacterised protein [Vibrio cholerae]